jgi:hypothetical protein
VPATPAGADPLPAPRGSSKPRTAAGGSGGRLDHRQDSRGQIAPGRRPIGALLGGPIQKETLYLSGIGPLSWVEVAGFELRASSSRTPPPRVQGRWQAVYAQVTAFVYGHVDPRLTAPTGMWPLPVRSQNRTHVSLGELPLPPIRLIHILGDPLLCRSWTYEWTEAGSRWWLPAWLPQ